MINEVFRTEKVCVRELVPSSKNPRKIKAVEKKRLWERLQKYGMISIPVRDADGVLLGGKQRCELLVEYGLGDVEIDVRTAVRKLNEDELREVMLIENSHAGEWDMEMLRREFDEFLDLSEFGLVLDEIGEELEKASVVGEDAELPIVARYGEKYSAVVVVCRNEIDLNHVSEKLGTEMSKDYKNNRVGVAMVVEASKLIASWK